MDKNFLFAFSTILIIFYIASAFIPLSTFFPRVKDLSLFNLVLPHSETFHSFGHP